MPLSICDLPLELREQIYNLVLISPTQCLYAERRPSKPRNGFYNKTSKATDKSSIELLPAQTSTGGPLLFAEPIHQSLSFTCRQIYMETSDMMWRNNIICFRSCESMVQLLKLMGQEISRRIEKIRLYILVGNSRQWQGFGRAMSMLASRSRKGCLKEVHVRLSGCDVREFATSVEDWNAAIRRNNQYMRMQNELKKGEEVGWRTETQRILELDDKVPNHLVTWLPEETLYEDRLEFFADAMRALHYAWGKTLSYDGTLIWENCKQIETLPYPQTPLWPPSAG